MDTSSLYLGNVVRFEQIVHIEEKFDRNSKLKEIIDNLLNTFPRFHLILRARALLLPQRCRTALEDYFFYNPSDIKILLY